MKITNNLITIFSLFKPSMESKRKLENIEISRYELNNIQNMNYSSQNPTFDSLPSSDTAKYGLIQNKPVRKNEKMEDFMMFEDYDCESLNIKLYNSNQFHRDFRNFTVPSSADQFEEPITTLIKMDENLLDFLDQNEISEPLEDELNTWKPISIDFDSLNDLLNDKQPNQNCERERKISFVKDNRETCEEDDAKIKLQEDSVKDTTVVECNNPILHTEKTVEVKYDAFNAHSYDDLFQTKLKSYRNRFKLFIEAYIFDNIPNSYSSSHIRRIKTLNQACETFDKHKISEIQYWYVFDNANEVDLICKLKNMLLTFAKESKFNQETVDRFLVEFEPKIFNSSCLYKMRCKMDNLTHSQKKLIFYLEVMKFYKFIVDIPELLSVIGLFSFKSCGYVISIIHLINLIAANTGNLRDNRIFILCMIYKMFECFYDNMFGIFTIPNYELVCDNDRHDLSFFLWEINGKKRYDIRCRNTITPKCIAKDKIFIKLVFYTYVYQHSILIKHLNVDNKEIGSFLSFVEKVKTSEDCVGCLFIEYLSIIQRIYEK